MRRLGAALSALLSLASASAGLQAQDAGSPTARAALLTPEQRLRAELELLANQRLSAPAAQTVDELDALLRSAHQRIHDGRSDEARLALLEAVHGTRFRAFESLPSFAAAELLLAKTLFEMRALESAQRGVQRLLARGPSSPTFGPAYQLAVDIGMLRGDHADSAEALAQWLKEPLPRSLAAELHYLRALAAHDRGALPEAQRELELVDAHSRFHASARYLLGTMAAARASYDEASARFTEVLELTRAGEQQPRAYYASAQLAASEDLARLGLARVAHERGRFQAAFSHYFRVPSDSPLLAEALFEAAYASYERGRYELALDSLAQLEARYPSSPHTAEARILHGYVELARLHYEQAERELVTFERTFTPLLSTLDELLASEAGGRRLFDAYASSDPLTRAAIDPLLLGLLRRDPELERLRAALGALDAELSRGLKLVPQLGELALAAREGKLPAKRLARDDEAPDLDQRLSALEQNRAELAQALSAFASELRTFARAGKREQLRELEQAERTLRERSDAVSARLRALQERPEQSSRAPRGGRLHERIEDERDHVIALRARALSLRGKLEQALVAVERRVLTNLRERLQHELRRARIGRIDAVMGKKRQAELAIEGLAAGHFPAERKRPQQTPTLLRDDEEFWPFEGEDWPDEFEERQR